MVAPTRRPQARGVKCDLCKKILATATWLDQTKLAKNEEDAQQVLDLIGQHTDSNCPCIPQDIGNLLIGSTHFEIHRLSFKRYNSQVQKQQYQYFVAAKQKVISESKRNQNQIINDCHKFQKLSRFKIHSYSNDCQKPEHQSRYLTSIKAAIDYWKLAMEDLTHPFNSKLALRLGLTHHVIYASYLFKYYKIYDYQLLTANLLLNLFKSIEGVTTNAIVHANYVLIRALIDCNQIQLAKQYLKQAIRISNYSDKTHYESILLTCVACELGLLSDGDTYTILDELSSLAVIKADDKLQHYYARTLAISIIIKYIHCFRGRSDLCFEFYHIFRYLCAIIRRCYEDCFEMVLSEKSINQSTNAMEGNANQIMDHSWIRFAVCDFVFATFDMLSDFYVRSGQPESLELLFNGLDLIAYRSGSLYWQARMASIGANLDILCDKYEYAREKLDSISRLIVYTSDSYLTSIMQLDQEVSRIPLLNQNETVINKKDVMNLLGSIKTCQLSLMDKTTHMELYDCKSNSFTKTSNTLENNEDLVVLGHSLSHLGLKLLKMATASLLKHEDLTSAKELIVRLGNQFERNNNQVLEYNDSHDLLETIVYFVDIENSKQHLLDSVKATNLFLKKPENDIESQLSKLTLNSEPIESKCPTRRRPAKVKSKIGQLSITQRSKRKGLYDVASKSEENLFDGKPIRFFDTIEALKNFSTLTTEELLLAYLRNSEPCPDYSLYARAHEMMFSHLLKHDRINHDQLLYHFTESSPSNTMRYRWMMFEEQQSSPFVAPANYRSSGNIKHLGFCGSLINQEKTLRSLVKDIPDECNLLQFKYILDKRDHKEHLLVVCLNNGDESVYVHLSSSILPDEFFDFMKEKTDKHQAMGIPERFSTKIEEAKRTLLFSNSQSRSEARKKIEADLKGMLYDIETDWFGPFRFLLCGRVCDSAYSKLIANIEKDLMNIMKHYHCHSTTCLRMMLENAPLLTRDEFCQSISAIFRSPNLNTETRLCHDKWLKSIEKYIANQAPNLKKDMYLQKLTRGQAGLILDRDLELIPFESLPIIRRINQGLFRVPSLRLYNIIVSRNCQNYTVDANETFYMLDPANNLGKTRERFESKLKSQISWSGTIGRPPSTAQLEQWLTTKQIYLFIGHGAGTTYYNNLCNGRGLSAMPAVRPLPIVMGCSSGRVLAEGPRLESFGINWIFIFRGAPSYVGLLWDVTDTDIDRFLDSLLSNWLGSRWNGGAAKSSKEEARIPLTEAIAHSRDVCQFKLLVGSTPIIYGLPFWSRT